MKKILITLFSVIVINIGFAQDAESYFQTGEALKASENYKGAIEAYSKALQAKPGYTNALLQKAFCEGAMGNYEASIADYSEIIKLRPDHKFSYFSRGSAYNKLKKYNEALADFNMVIQLDPKDEEGYNNRGWAKKGLEDTDGACKDWNKSKKLGNAEAKTILKNNKCK